MAKRNILQPNAAVIPAAATLYCMGIEALTAPVHGFSFASLDKYRQAATSRDLHMRSASSTCPCSPAVPQLQTMLRAAALYETL